MVFPASLSPSNQAAGGSNARRARSDWRRLQKSTSARNRRGVGHLDGLLIESGPWHPRAPLPANGGGRQVAVGRFELDQPGQQIQAAPAGSVVSSSAVPAAIIASGRTAFAYVSRGSGPWPTPASPFGAGTRKRHSRWSSFTGPRGGSGSEGEEFGRHPKPRTPSPVAMSSALARRVRTA